MPKPPAADMQDAPHEVREIYDAALRGDPAAVRDMLARRPELLAAFLVHYGTVGSRLDRRTYEIVYLRVSTMNGCEPCVRAHRESSQWVGLTAQHWQALEAGDSSPFDLAEQAALGFAEKLTREPQTVEAADVAGLKKYLSAEQAVDLQLLVELAKLSSRLQDPLEVDLRGPAVKVSLNPDTKSGS